jgi:hypothetical protein
MKYLLLIYFSILSFYSPAQDSLRKIEKDQETSFENYELLIIALVGFVLLMGLRYWFKRTRNK